jgi:transcriptional regulator with XRE-family HTH domain
VILSPFGFFASVNQELTKMIAEWLAEKRKNKSLTLTELAQITGLTHATLSRIETQSLQLTLFSAVRIMHALDLSWTELFIRGFIKPDLPIPEIHRAQNQPSLDFPCLLFGDLDTLDTSGLMRRGLAPAVVRHLLSLFIKKYEPSLSDEKTGLLAENFYSLLNSPESKDGIARESLPDLDFRYPQDFPPESLRNIYLSGGALTLLDLGRYVRYLRETQKMSLRQVATLLELTHPALSNFELNPGDRVKLNDIIHLDNALGLDGELVIFAWRTAELYLGIHRVKTGQSQKIQPWNQPEIHLIEKLITTSRLFQRYFPDNREWLDWYREQSLNGFEDVVR